MGWTPSSGQKLLKISYGVGGEVRLGEGFEGSQWEKDADCGATCGRGLASVMTRRSA